MRLNNYGIMKKAVLKRLKAERMQKIESEKIKMRNILPIKIKWLKIIKNWQIFRKVRTFGRVNIIIISECKT